MSSIAVVCQDIAKSRKSRARKYSFTPAMDDAIRQAYRLFLDYGNRKAIGACATKLQLPKWIVTRRAGMLGLARVKDPAWSSEEVAVLERWGHLTDAVIRGKLKAAGFHRSINGIHLKMRRLRIKQNLDGYSANALAAAFGVDGHKITYWINRKMLKATHRGTGRTERQGGDTYWITRKAVHEFVLSYPDEVDLRKVEKWWFLDLITGSRIGMR